MFLKTSRYADTPQITVTLENGAQSAAVRLRPIPATTGDPTPVTSNDRLDIMAQRISGDATRFWHIADANTALDPNRLFVQWLAEDQNAPQLEMLVPEE